MSDPSDPQSWVEKAEEDYVVAQLCLDQQPALSYPAAFHAQRCAEKYLKAVLVARGQEPPRIHDVAALATLCQTRSRGLDLSARELMRLNDFAVRTRYPGAGLSAAEARVALAIAENVRRVVRQALGLG